MGQKPPDASKDEPTLELPHFGRRGRIRKPAEQAGTEPPHEPATDEASAEPVEAHGAKGKGFSFPAVPGVVAAIVSGVVVGAFGTAMTYLAIAGCDAIRGASTCGRAGIFPLVAILILMVLLGAVMLRAAQVSNPGSTSFLAVGLLGVIALLLLTDIFFSGWIFLIVPILCAASYALSHWVATRFVEEPD
jgi:hypothetical protein